jgi:hypothetical protein
MRSRSRAGRHHPLWVTYVTASPTEASVIEALAPLREGIGESFLRLNARTASLPTHKHESVGRSSVSSRAESFGRTCFPRAERCDEQTLLHRVACMKADRMRKIMHELAHAPRTTL